MYELLVLGSLLSRDMSGYKLCQVLGNALVPRRKISNGVMYPLLNKLAAAGYYVRDGYHGCAWEKVAHLTTTGRAHLHDMLMTPVATDAKRESLYRFKFKGMATEPVVVQIQILNEYKEALLTDLQIYQQVYLHLKEKLATASMDRLASLNWSIRTLELQIAESETKIKWSNQQLQDLRLTDSRGGKL